MANQPGPGGLVIDVLVVPRASRTAVGPMVGDRLRVAVTSPPVDGEANAAVVAALAEAFGVRRAAVEIVRGERGRRKTVRIAGVVPRCFRPRARPESIAVMRRGLAAGLLLLSACAGSGLRPAQTPASASPQASGQPSRSGLNCGRQDEMFGPSIVPREVYASRTGVMARKFSELGTSKEKPLEECGLRTVLKRLVMLTCDDGFEPFRRRPAGGARLP